MLASDAEIGAEGCPVWPNSMTVSAMGWLSQLVLRRRYRWAAAIRMAPSESTCPRVPVTHPKDAAAQITDSAVRTTAVCESASRRSIDPPFRAAAVVKAARAAAAAAV